jgi:hypothetical protein
MSSVLCQHGVVGIGAASIRTLRAALGQDLGEDVGATRVQEMGFAAGAEVYQSFCAWLPSHADLRDPADLSADALPEVLSAFFGALGWGTVSTERVGQRGLVVASPDWAESVLHRAAGQLLHVPRAWKCARGDGDRVSGSG